MKANLNKAEKNNKGKKKKKKIEKFNVSATTIRAHLQFAWSLERLAGHTSIIKYYSNIK